jgi:phosphatidylglycerol:prolipoprotein diacylglycerol transferase
MTLLRSYATISDLLEGLIGLRIPLPVFSFGFFVALAFLIAAWLLTKELKRKEKQGLLSPVKEDLVVGEPPSFTEVAINAIIGGLLGFKFGVILSDYNAFSSNPQELIFSSEGSILGALIGAAFLGYLKYYEKKKQQLPKPEKKKVNVFPHQRVGDIVVLAAVFGILGAKIFSNFEEPNGWQDFFRDPLGNFFSGLTIYGGLILGAAAVIWFARRKKICVLHLGDAAAPALILAYGIGRIGCQVSGDGDWGIYNSAYVTAEDGSIVEADDSTFIQVLEAYPTYFSYSFSDREDIPHTSFRAPSWMPVSWVAQNFAHNVNDDGLPLPDCEGKFCSVLPVPVFPTAMYETIMSVLLFGLLWVLRKRIAVPGVLFALYIFMTGLERFWIEKIRVNNIVSFAGMKATQAEFISVGLMLFALGFLLVLIKRNRTLTVGK